MYIRQGRSDIYRQLHMMMRRFVLLLVLAALYVVFFTLFSQPASAAQTTPYTVNFQGRLTDAAGNPRPDGLYNMRFRMFTVASGGVAVGTETFEAGNRIQVTNGLFNVALGSVSGLTPADFTNYPLYLEVELPTPATATCSTASCASWTEGAMTPRSTIGAAPYAMNADTVDGIDGANLAQLSANNTFTGTNIFKPTANSTSAFAIQASGGANLLVADTTNMALKVGGGDVSADGSPALLVLDHKNTSGDPTGVNGAMYYNSSSKKLRCHENGEWKDCIANFSLRDGYKYQTDLTFPTYPASGTAVDTTLAPYWAGSASFSAANSEVGHPGITRTTATGTSIAGLMTVVTFAGSPVYFGSVSWNYLSNVRLSHVSDGTNNYTYRVGYMNAISTATEAGITQGCYLRYNHAVNSGNWQGVCRVGTSESVCDTGLAMTANAWHVTNIAMNAAGTLATFTVDDTNQCTVNSNIPASSEVMAYGYSTQRTAGSTSRTTDVDYIDARSVFTR